MRVYLDDKLVGSLHRRNVVEKDPSVDADGTAHYQRCQVVSPKHGCTQRGETVVFATNIL